MTSVAELPGLDCGLCGFRKCADLAARLEGEPKLLDRCIHLKKDDLGTGGRVMQSPPKAAGTLALGAQEGACRANAACAGCATVAGMRVNLPAQQRSRELGAEVTWRDSLDREFDFYLEHFPEEPGPRETIIPHNPMITREMEITKGDLLIGRPLGMSCGCPITHCGVVMDVDHRTGVINWCVTGPLKVREHGFKDIGYYIAEAYDGLIRTARCDIRIGARYFFQPRMCMLQWRHSGLVNFVNKAKDGLQVRLEGLWIG
jgi:uncharacterized Fe-S cluster-containing protein